MFFNRRKGGAEARSTRLFGSLEEYIRLIVNVFSAMEIARTHWLTEREKQFFIATVMNDLLGHTNPISEESINTYRTVFKRTVTKVNIADYIGRLVDKNWISYDVEKKKVEIPLLFRGINIEKDILDFKLQLVYEEVVGSDSN